MTDLDYKARPKRLLAVDWDFFFPQPEWADWSHAESELYLNLIWGHRGADCLRATGDLPGTDGTWRTFWDRFKVQRGATLYVAESNCRAAREEVAGGMDEVWLYDAHHDAGYRGVDGSFDRGPAEGRYDCEDWMLLYAQRAINAGRLTQEALHVRYPTHRPGAFEEEPDPAVPVDRAFDDGEPNPLRFDRIFLCRSGAWVPPWCDGEFEEFADAAPVAETVEFDSYERSFDRAEAETHAAQMQAMLDRAEADNAARRAGAAK